MSIDSAKPSLVSRFLVPRAWRTSYEVEVLGNAFGFESDQCVDRDIRANAKNLGYRAIDNKMAREKNNFRAFCTDGHG